MFTRMIPFVGACMLLSLLGFEMQNNNPVYAQNSWMGLPGAVLNSQINMQQKFGRKNNYATPSSMEPVQDTVIFTDRRKRPISQQEFMNNVRQQHIETYNAELEFRRSLQKIEPPPPEDASFQ